MDSYDNYFKEITTIEELKEIRLGKIGYIVFVDKPPKNKVHMIPCPLINELNFSTHVIFNKCVSGRYIFVRNLDFAKSEYQASECALCF